MCHANLLAGAKIVAEYLQLTAHDRLLAALPLSFDAGLNQLTTALLVGATTTMIDFKFGRDIVRCLEEERITGLAGVTSLWALVAHARSGLDKAKLPHLRYLTNTGGVLPVPTIFSGMDAMTPECRLVQAYTSILSKPTVSLKPVK